MDTRVKKKKIKKKRSKAVVFFITLPLLILFFSATGYGAYLYFKATNAVEASHKELDRGVKSEMREAAVKPLEDNVSVLFMGVDASEKRATQYGNAVRTDALILATFNREDSSIKLLSIPRDTYTYIDVEGKYDKINHAHAFGGVDATVKSVEDLLKVPVDYYAKINFEAFLGIVDALGGIDVDVPITFTEQNSKDEPGAITLQKGPQTLNGEQALALARTRKIDSDIERGKRQQLVIESIIKKSMSISSVTKYGDLIDTLGENLATNLSFQEMMSFMGYATKASALTIESLQLKGQDAYIGGVYYYQPDDTNLMELQQTLHAHLNDVPSAIQRETSSENNDLTIEMK